MRNRTHTMHFNVYYRQRQVYRVYSQKCKNIAIQKKRSPSPTQTDFLFAGKLGSDKYQDAAQCEEQNAPHRLDDGTEPPDLLFVVFHRCILSKPRTRDTACPYSKTTISLDGKTIHLGYFYGLFINVPGWNIQPANIAGPHNGADPVQVE